MGSPSFAEVLAWTLQGATGPALSFRVPSYAPAAAYPLRDAAVPELAGTGAAFALRAAIGATARPRRPLRTLTSGQRQSLEALNAAGADLSDNFTAQELRRAYRRLAQRLHPDRQHDAGAAERTRLGERFGNATVHYRRLLAVVSPGSSPGTEGS